MKTQFAGASTALLFTFSLLVWASTLDAQVAWSRISTPNAPAARTRTAGAFDEARDRLVVFGGWINSTADDTWLFDGSTWTRATTATTPISRQRHAMAYDRARQRVVMFGGLHALGGNPFHLTLADTWEWDGTAWTEVVTANTPPPRARASFCYDAARGCIVMFGGYAIDPSGNITNLDDTWLFDGADWTQVATPVRPSRRSDAMMVYDSVRRSVILYGGAFDLGTGNSSFFADTWRWDGVAWTRLNPSATPPTANGEAMVFDEARGRAVRILSFGSTRLYEWDGVDWRARTATPALGNRAFFAAAYDPTRARTLAFGGSVISGCCSVVPVAETWAYGPQHPAGYTEFGVGCAGTTGVPHLSGDALPWISDTATGELTNVPPNAPSAVFLGASNTTFRGLSLPFDLGGFGAPGCSILAALRAPVVTATGGGGGSVPWMITVPNDTTLLGRTHYLQGLVLDPANALGVTASNGLALTPGGR